MEIKGKVIEILPIQEGVSNAGRSWQKASLIIEVAENPQYPKKIKISNMKSANAFSKLAVGSEGTFKVEIESREYNGRWYTEINCWGWDVSQVQQAQEQQPTQQSEYLKTMRQPIMTSQQTDDLPF